MEYKVLAFGLALLLCITLSSAISNDELESKMAAMAEKVLSCKSVTGFSLGVVQNGTVLLRAGYGVRDRERGLPVTETTLFGIASLTKAFAVTLLSKLLHEHPKFSLDTPVREILGEELCFADGVLNSLATVRDLMAHRTGLPKYNRARLQHGLTRNNLATKLRYFVRTEEFRDKYLYNNLMYGLLTVITEAVGGATWEHLLNEHLFQPLGMLNATFTHMTDLDREDMARAYWRMEDGEWRQVSPTLHREWGRLGGSGSIVLHEVDMLKWVSFQLALGRNMDGEQVVPEQVILETHQPVISMPDCGECYLYRRPHKAASFTWNNYALGWRTGFYRGYPLILHTGSSFGYTAKLTLVPDLNLGIHMAVTGQDPGFHARRAIHSYAMDLVMGVADPIVTLDNVCAYPYTESPPTTNSTQPPYTTTVPVKEPELYVGTYGNNGYGEVEVVYNESSNMLQLKYGFLGRWDLYVVEEQVHTFRGEGLDHVWVLSLKSLTFQDQIGNKMTSLTVPDFETANPPVFVRDQKPPENEPSCEMFVSSSGSGIFNFYSLFTLMPIIQYFIL